MENIIIKAPSQKSVIRCGRGAFEKYASPLADKKIFVVTDSNVAEIYGELIENTFKGAPMYVIKAGEASKNFNTLLAILKKLAGCGATRSWTVVAMGGGVVGDVAGLAASLYMRGVNLVQIPTTLLSQVDSSVGGKTAVDMCGVKNVVGTFYQPGEVIVDPMFLATLPRRELRCGLGEIIKYGALDGGIFESLCANKKRLFSPQFLLDVIAPCIRHKAAVVTKDEKDVSGARKTLNLGHTTGHAFELYYKRKSHGEFVLVGMYYELYIAVEKGVCTAEYARRIIELIKKVIGNAPAYADAERAAMTARFDKKNSEQSQISLIVPKAKGECAEITLPANEYAALINKCARLIKEGKW